MFPLLQDLIFRTQEFCPGVLSVSVFWPEMDRKLLGYEGVSRMKGNSPLVDGGLGKDVVHISPTGSCIVIGKKA